jgi:Tol biopolymer transport system component
MKNNVFRIFLISIFGLFSLLQAQGFGKNKVRYDDFDWSFIQTSNFDIYFYGGGEELANMTASVAEKALENISSVLNWRMRKRITLIIYNSHADFQQTNVTLDYLSEGILGFTELFKNRAVVPFDGSNHDFWHTVRHELVHVVVNDMIYGGNVQSIISGRVRINIPLWMNEGLAEYISMGWDTNADMILRDIATSSDIPTIEQLDYYLAYKGGQSVYRFLGEKYSIEKVGEIWSEIKGRKSVEKGFKSAIGLDLKELTEEWHKWVRREYWPDVGDRDELEDIAIRLTNHKKIRNYFNTGPAISPNGTSVAMMSDRNGYADVYLISIIDGKIIKKLASGQKTPELEELKWLNPRLSWSPDGSKVVFAVKSGSTDALIVLDVKTGLRQRYIFENLEEIFTADWSPDGKQIAFIGLRDNRSDLYTYHLESGELLQLTEDIYSDFEPHWSSDNQGIYYASQRGRTQDDAQIEKFIDLDQINYHQTDIFYYDLKIGSVRRITDTPWNENYPTRVFAENKLLYTSDAQGVSNLYLMDLDTGESRAITNVLTGVFQPSLARDNSRLVFAGYADNGWDIYYLTNPLDLAAREVKPTRYATELVQQWEQENFNRFVKASPENVRESYVEFSQSNESNQSYSHYIFAPGYNDFNTPKEDIGTDTTTVLEDTVRFKRENGQYLVKDYKTRFSLDLIDSQAGYSTFWGFQGTTVFAFSDILGNHQLLFGTEMYVDLENSDYYLAYAYLGKRNTYSVMGFHSANFWPINLFQMWRLRNYGGDFSVSRPFSKFSRMELGLTSYNVQQTLIDIYQGGALYQRDIYTILPRTAYIYDNTLWAYFYPINGWRMRFDFILSPKYNQNSLDFQTIEMDLRRYFKLNREYSFAFRLSAGISEGKNPQRFFLGGESNWINQKYKDNPNFGDPEEIFFSEFVTPLRGARYWERNGTRYFLANLEFRYPFIKYLALGWPLPMQLGGIQGVTFLDLGSAWTGNDLHMIGRNLNQSIYFDDLVGGFGVGTRLYFGYFLLKIDVAWQFDLDVVSKPLWYFSLGTDF